MSATDFTPEQLQVRKDTLEAVVTREHDQGDWINHPGLYGKLGQPEFRGISVVPIDDSLCGTAGCAAGHAVLSKISGQRARKENPDDTFFEVEYQFAETGEWMKENALLEAVGGGGYGDWIGAGAALLGLGWRSANLLFNGNNSHEQVVYSLQRLVAGKKIRELRTEFDAWSGTTSRVWRLIKPPKNFKLPDNDINVVYSIKTKEPVEL